MAEALSRKAVPTAVGKPNDQIEQSLLTVDVEIEGAFCDPQFQGVISAGVRSGSSSGHGSPESK